MPISGADKTKQVLSETALNFKVSAHSPATSYCHQEDVHLRGSSSIVGGGNSNQDGERELGKSDEVEGALKLALHHYSEGSYENAFAELQRLGGREERATYQIAAMKYDGIGTGVDCAQAMKLMSEIAYSNNPRTDLRLKSCALYNLGRAHYEGYGCRQSDSEAVRLWTMAASEGEKTGCVHAMATLGKYYSRASEPSFDLAKAHFWHQEATANGSIESQGALGVMYEHGLGVDRNEKASFLCYKRAAEQGNLFAMGNLARYYYKARMYNHSVGLAEKLSELEDCGEIAKETGCEERYANKGLALGCFLHARCHEKGIGVERNRERAASLYAKAAKHDVDTVAHLHDELLCGEL